MQKVGFDVEKYLKMQSKNIIERVSKFDNKLYLEFGGKLFDDYHASRVLPGFEPDSKIRILGEMKEKTEIIVVISATDIESNKVRSDLGITYDADVLRLIDEFRRCELYVGSVVITQYSGQNSADAFKSRLETLGVKCYIHYMICGYPSNLSLIVSDDGYGKNEYIETSRPLIAVTAPGPGSGKMAVCLSQLYHDHKRGINSGYAKYETFPVWNLPLSHPVNIAYESATLDLLDSNMIDPYHLEAFQETTVNYNRDIEIFPVLNEIFTKIYGESPYKSPTDMGVNMAGKCIIDEDIVKESARQEIIRRYYAEACLLRRGLSENEKVFKAEILINQAHTELVKRHVAVISEAQAKSNGSPVVAIELHDGTIITGKTSNLFGASSSALLNALKHLANIGREEELLSRIVVETIQKLKTTTLGSTNPRLHTDETLIALSMSAVTNENSKKALEQIDKLKNTEGHSSVIISNVDESLFRKIGVNMSCSPTYEYKKLYHK
ncbi:MAG: DUF1846 domain-containing protein [Clostridia bacterium]